MSLKGSEKDLVCNQDKQKAFPFGKAFCYGLSAFLRLLAVAFQQRFQEACGMRFFAFRHGFRGTRHQNLTAACTALASAAGNLPSTQSARSYSGAGLAPTPTRTR